jgi:hypothetical protein
MNGDNLDNVRRDANRNFRTKEREYLKDGINEIEANGKNKHISDLY